MTPLHPKLAAALRRHGVKVPEQRPRTFADELRGRIAAVQHLGPDAIDQQIFRLKRLEALTRRMEVLTRAR